MEELIIPNDYDDHDTARIESLEELRRQIDAFFGTFKGEWSNLRYTDDADDIDYGVERSEWYSGTWHMWQDGLYLATLRAIAEGVDDPVAWAKEALRLVDAEYRRWYE